MSITVNGQSCVPPGFRFHPTEEELLNYYLRKKVASQRIDLDVIPDVDLNKLEPWDIQEKCKIGTTPQNEWYFFSHKDKKYPTGTRTNRATTAGFWKATGRDKVIHTSIRRIGMRKTLVFYQGRAPHGQKSDWIMHEYRLDDNSSDTCSFNSIISSPNGEAATQEEGWVICKVFKKKLLLQKTSNCSSSIISSEMKSCQLIVDTTSTSSDTLEQIIQYMGRSCKQDHKEINCTTTTTSTDNRSSNYMSTRPLTPISIENLFNTSTIMHADRFMKLPPLESPTAPPSVPTDWASLDSFAAGQLNIGQLPSTLKQTGALLEEYSGFGFGSASVKLMSSKGEENYNNGGDGDLWSFTKSTSTVYSPCMSMTYMESTLSP